MRSIRQGYSPLMGTWQPVSDNVHRLRMNDYFEVENKEAGKYEAFEPGDWLYQGLKGFYGEKFSADEPVEEKKRNGKRSGHKSKKDK